MLNDGTVQAQPIAYFMDSNNIPQKSVRVLLKSNEFVVGLFENQYGICVELNTKERPICFPEDISPTENDTFTNSVPMMPAKKRLDIQRNRKTN